MSVFSQAIAVLLPKFSLLNLNAARSFLRAIRSCRNFSIIVLTIKKTPVLPTPPAQ